MIHPSKNSQYALINLLRPQNNKYISSNQNSLKNLLKNLKNGKIISHNNCCISKFKTTKNSPQRLLFDNTIGARKNKMKNNAMNQKRTEKIMEEILKNKIIKNRDKRSSENESNSLNKRSMYKNYKQVNNNISHVLSNKFNAGPVIAGLNSYRAPQKITKNLLNGEYIYNNKNKNNLRDKKLISSSTNKQNSKNNGAPYNTIMAKNNTKIKSTDKMVENKKLINKANSLFSSTMSSLNKSRPQKQSTKNYNFDVKSKTSYPTKNNSRKPSNENNKAKYKNDSSKNKYNHNNVNHNINHMNHMRVYSDKNISKNKTPIITKDNYKLDSNNNYIINSNGGNKKYINEPNIIQIIPNGLNCSQYNKLSNLNSTNNSKEYSRENSTKQKKLNNNIPDLKKFNIDKILNQMHKDNKVEKELKNKIIKNKNFYSDINNHRDAKKNNKIFVNENKNPIIIKEDKVKELPKEEKVIENKKVKEDKKKKISDKDLSDDENDSLLQYVNNNIDNNVNQDTLLNDSNSSIISTLKENGKFSCYNRDMEIISNYIKNFYSKYNKYPSTKMNFYKYGRLLGKGAFGKVNLSLHVLTGRLVAIKSINKSKLTNERQRRKIQIETTIMKTLSKSNNIVKIFETYETKKHYCIVMEYICAGDLLSYIKKRGKLTEEVAKFIFKQIVLTLQYIHNHNIVHRDIKLDNILIDLDNNIKICDFGVSKIIKNNEPLMEQCGTPAYIAPEILLNRGYEGFGVDIWSAGVVLYAMLSGTVPFKGNNIKDLHDLIIKGEYPSIKELSKEASHLIKCILEVDPKKRINIKDILVHPWLIDVDLNYWKTQNLFTNAEYFLLAKSNVDYRDISNKDDMIEIFDIKNLDTNDENQNKNIKTKSFILAPFNSSIEYENDDDASLDCNNTDLKTQNGLIKFNNKVKDLNRNYELNNNQEIDNGVVISPNASDEKNKKDDISPYNGSYNSKGHSKPFSPPIELEENANKNKVNFVNLEDEINDKALNDLGILGYKKSFVKDSLIKNNFNYSTTGYRLIVKYCYS